MTCTICGYLCAILHDPFQSVSIFDSLSISFYITIGCITLRLSKVVFIHRHPSLKQLQVFLSARVVHVVRPREADQFHQCRASLIAKAWPELCTKHAQHL